MRFTNKKKIAAGVCALAISCLISGCASKEYRFAYDPDASVSSFQMSENMMMSQADLFAEELCVTATDVNHGAKVDASQFSSAALFALNQNEVLYAKNIHERLYPASTTKVMTALVALELASPDTRVTVDASAVGAEGSSVYLSAGEELTLEVIFDEKQPQSEPVQPAVQENAPNYYYGGFHW